jgi:hypothetical protein
MRRHVCYHIYVCTTNALERRKTLHTDTDKKIGVTAYYRLIKKETKRDRIITLLHVRTRNRVVQSKAGRSFYWKAMWHEKVGGIHSSFEDMHDTLSHCRV